MSEIFKTEDGERAVHARYRELLAYWPTANEQLRLPTGEGETFIVASGPVGAPALILLHGAQSNVICWMGDVAAWSGSFRVYAIDVIGDVGLSAPSRPKLDTEGYALWLDDVLAGLGLTRAALASLAVPVMAVVGGKDALIDSAGTRRRLERQVPGAEVRLLPDAYHLLPSQIGPVLDFLRRALGPAS